MGGHILGTQICASKLQHGFAFEPYFTCPGNPRLFYFFSMLACFQVHLVGVRGVASKDDRGLNNKNNPTYLEGGVGLLIKQLLM